MDQEEPRADNVVPEAEFFWRKFKYYLRQMVYGEITQQDFVDNIFVHPASHDAGTALGAALVTHHQERGWLPKIDFPTAYWGSKFNGVQIEHAIKTFEL